MSVVALQHMSPGPEGWTVEDLDQFPDDGLQRELLDGMLLMSPAPILLHQRVVACLQRRLEDAAPSALAVFGAPVDWRPDAKTSLQPDATVVTDRDLDLPKITEGLVLAVEVLSPSTRGKDRLLKFSAYQEHGVGSYWIVDPVEPSITCWDLVDGAYVEVGHATGDEQASLTRPFPVTIVPADLLRSPGTTTAG